MTPFDTAYYEDKYIAWRNETQRGSRIILAVIMGTCFIAGYLVGVLS
jgi:hypothetical protein